VFDPLLLVISQVKVVVEFDVEFLPYLKLPLIDNRIPLLIEALLDPRLTTVTNPESSI